MPASSPYSICNPILPGFHPDPSILRVGKDFYIATSTFEWFPGVLIYHSRDLVNWRLVSRPLDSPDLLDMRGEDSSCGVWAPCLSYDGEYYYLTFSDVKSQRRPYWDVHNYLVRSREITGPWIDRVYLNRSGFDPSLFHDRDGRKWLTNLIQDPRPGKRRFAGILLQEYDTEAKNLIGESRVIFKGTGIGFTEGPHLYQKDNYYYLMTAEGGTSWKHAVTMARSKQIEGPYEVDPNNPILTSWEQESAVLFKAGHASLVDTPSGEWYIAHLCSRPILPHKRCMLGRETALQKVEWTKDGWLRMNSRGKAPECIVSAPALPSHPFPEMDEITFFNCPSLPAEFQTLREPPSEDWFSLSERKGWLRLYGRLSLGSNFDQSLVGRRLQHFHCLAETIIDFKPEHYLQTAGLAAFYDDQHWFYLAISHDEEMGRVLRLIFNHQYVLSEPLGAVPIPDGPIGLRARLNAPNLTFSWKSETCSDWQELEPRIDATVLSDEVGERNRFTGTFFVLCAQDHMNKRTPADFQYFRYAPQEA